MQEALHRTWQIIIDMFVALYLNHFKVCLTAVFTSATCSFCCHCWHLTVDARWAPSILHFRERVREAAGRRSPLPGCSPDVESQRHLGRIFRAKRPATTTYPLNDHWQLIQNLLAYASHLSKRAKSSIYHTKSIPRWNVSAHFEALSFHFEAFCKWLLNKWSGSQQCFTT